MTVVRYSMEFFPDRVVPAASGELVDLWIYSAYPKKAKVLGQPVGSAVGYVLRLVIHPPE